MDINNTGDFLFYQSKDGNISVQIIIGDETVWTTQKGMGEIFGVQSNNITYHLNEIYKNEELTEDATTQKIRVVQKEGNRDVSRELDFYNLDAILSVGYRVSSPQATQFRIWANKVLKEYLIKGFALDDERLKQGKQMYGKDYFDELLQRIREIRASERRFYQKVTDLYALSVDYNPSSPVTKAFFAEVQNKLEFAITHFTAAEIIKQRANADMPSMGLQTWSNAPHGKILRKDVTVAKNFLKEDEINELNRIVNMYLDYAENQAQRNKLMKMNDWIVKLDAFLQFNEYDVLKNAGKIRKQVADDFAGKEFDKFRVIQDREYQSDFDKVVISIKATGQLPKDDTPLTEITEVEPTGIAKTPERSNSPLFRAKEIMKALGQQPEPETDKPMSFGAAIKKIAKAGKPPKDEPSE